MNKKGLFIILAVLAAALYALNVPLAKIFLENVSPSMMAGLLYLGAGVGMGFVIGVRKIFKRADICNPLGREDIPYTVLMVMLDIAAPILLMYGIKNTAAANVSLLNNFEIVATSVIAFVVFKERISGRLTAAIVLVVAASAILGFEGSESLSFDAGSLFVILASSCWGLENNCTRKISDKSSEQIVLIKGVFSGAGSIAAAFIMNEAVPDFSYILPAMLLGFISYGLSIDFYIRAQSVLGAAKTSAFYAVAPFLGVGFSFLIPGENPRQGFIRHLQSWW